MMTDRYQETLNYIYEKLPLFSRIGKAALKPDLTNTLKLCALLGNPQDKFKSVHIAGTNGKGSVSHGLAAILQDAGYKTGLYTSPHLVDFRERIRINGIEIGEETVIDFVHQHKQAIEEIEPSFFEITVALAFDYFAKEQVDIAVIETGLGGRLDSTNVINPLLSIITNISYDHTDLLGNTLAQIATEKAGIIKKGVPVVIGEQHDETERVFFEHSVMRQSPLYYAQAQWELARTGQDISFQFFKAHNKQDAVVYDLKTDLLGNYQINNLKTILSAAGMLAFQGFNLTTENAIESLANVKQKTGLKGRWEVVSRQPVIICDVAHNPAGLREVLRQWNNVAATTKHIIVGFVRDKDIRQALALLPGDAQYYFTNAAIPRALPADELQCLAAESGLIGPSFFSVSDAIAAAKTNMAAGDALLITGSFFVVGEALEYLQKNSPAV